MKASTLKYYILTIASFAVLAILALIPFHAFMTVWATSVFGHYTAFRLWKEVLLAFCALLAIYLVLFDAKIRTHTMTRRLLHIIAAYMVVTLVWALIAVLRDSVTIKAAAYGTLLNLRYLAFFVICWAVAVRSSRLQKYWLKVVLVPAALVIGFGLLQILVLPHDFLRHFGYSDATIPAFETINNNGNYVRIQSFLRGANPLGTYLIIPLTVAFYWALKNRKDWRYWTLLSAGVVVLAYSFSRAAWIGFIVSMITVVAVMYGAKISRKWWLIGAASVVLVGIVGVITVNQNARLQNIFLHTETKSSVATSSNGGHVAALRQGASDVLNEPFGRGPGSAGPASVYNNHPPRIAENYYLQIGQEVGWLGLGLFVSLQLGIAYIFWMRKNEPLQLCLLASLAGITVVAMLSHPWTDDTLAYLWWGLAGIALVPTITKHAKKR